MARFTISDSIEEPVSKTEMPEYEHKGRYSIEEPSQFKRKSQIAMKNFAKGLTSSATLIHELTKNPLLFTLHDAIKDPKSIFEKSAELAKELEEKLDLTPPEAESTIERLMEGAFKGAESGAIFGPAGAITGAVGGFG